MSAWRQFRYRLEYSLTLAGMKGLRHLGLGQAQAIGRFLGRSAYTLGVARGTTLSNLKTYLGVEGSEARRIASRAYANFGQTMSEVAYMPALDLARLDDMFEFEGLEQLEVAKARGKGIVCMSAHYGNWEWMGAAFIRRGFPVTFLIGTQSNPYVDKLFNSIRAKAGIQFVRIQAIRDALRVLKGNGMVALLGDQDGDKWGTFAPFFGAQASTHSIGELLARRSGATLAFGVPVRVHAEKHHLKVHVIEPYPEALNEAQGPAWTLARYNALLEAAIREHPDHWLWMHERWRSVPLHRLSGEPRARAERGEIAFDLKDQVWRRTVDGVAENIPWG